MRERDEREGRERGKFDEKDREGRRRTRGTTTLIDVQK